MESVSASSSQLPSHSSASKAFTQQAEENQLMEQTNAVEKARARRATEARLSAHQAQTEVEQNRPTVNSFGHVVGTIINTTA